MRPCIIEGSVRKRSMYSKNNIFWGEKSPKKILFDFVEVLIFNLTDAHS